MIKIEMTMEEYDGLYEEFYKLRQMNTKLKTLVMDNIENAYRQAVDRFDLSKLDDDVTRTINPVEYSSISCEELSEILGLSNFYYNYRNESDDMCRDYSEEYWKIKKGQATT